MTGLEELDAVQHILGCDFELAALVEALNAEQILTLVRACREAVEQRAVSGLPADLPFLFPSDLSADQIEAAARRGEVPCFQPGAAWGDADKLPEPPHRLARFAAPSKLRVAIARKYHPVQQKISTPNHRITTGGCGHIPRPGVCGSCSEP